MTVTLVLRSACEVSLQPTIITHHHSCDVHTCVTKLCYRFNTTVTYCDHVSPVPEVLGSAALGPFPAADDALGDLMRISKVDT